MTRRPLMLDIVRAFYWFDDALQSGLKGHGWDVTRTQSTVMINIAFGANRASDLARNLGVTRQAMSQMLNDLQRKGYIVVEPDPNDGRAQVINFSVESEVIREHARTLLAEIEAALESRIGKRRVAALNDAFAQDWGPSVIFVGKPAGQKAGAD